MDFDAFRLAASTADLAEEPAARAHADLLEFRMDLADSPAEALASYDGELPLLVTNRAEWEGGEATDEGRLDALCAAVEHDAVEAVDVELAAIAGDEGLDVVEAARANDAAVVVSVHDFEETPPREELSRLLTHADNYGDVAKLAVTAQSKADVLHLLGVTYAHAEQGDTVATMAMGEPGRHSRAVAPLYGSRIGYAPVDPERATAPGQYALETLADLVERLESR